MKTLLPLCLIALTCAVATAQERQPAGHIFARVGNGVAFAKQGTGLGVGVGVEFDLGPRWAMLTEGEYISARYQPNAFDGIVLDQTDYKTSSRSWASSCSMLRYWTLGATGEHRFGAGLGVLWRGLTVETVQRATIAWSAAPGEFKTSDEFFGAVWGERINVAPVVTYRGHIGKQVNLGAFLRYEHRLAEKMYDYQYFLLRADDGGIDSLTSGHFDDNLDGLRAVSYGVTLGYTLL